jgi:hypothetical protein
LKSDIKALYQTYKITSLIIEFLSEYQKIQKRHIEMSSSNNYGAISNSETMSSASGSRQFSPTEFLILKESIATNIIKIKSQTSKFSKIIRLIGGTNDNNDLRSKM